MLRRSHSPIRGARSVSRRRVPVALALGLAMVATVLSATPASATPQGDLNSLNAQAQRIENQIQADNQRADVLDEQYLEAQSAVAAAQAQIADGERAIGAAEASVAKLQNRLGGRAAR